MRYRSLSKKLLEVITPGHDECLTSPAHGRLDIHENTWRNSDFPVAATIFATSFSVLLTEFFYKVLTYKTGRSRGKWGMAIEQTNALARPPDPLLATHCIQVEINVTAVIYRRFLMLKPYGRKLHNGYMCVVQHVRQYLLKEDKIICTTEILGNKYGLIRWSHTIPAHTFIKNRCWGAWVLFAYGFPSDYSWVLCELYIPPT